jgi:23S rRNA (adenine2503-C2)-methyltransferase
MIRTPLFDIPFSRLRDVLVSLGEPAYRATQLYDAVLRRGSTDVESITTLSAATRARLGAAFSLHHAHVAQESLARDGVIKLLVELGGRAEDTSGADSAAALGIAAKKPCSPSAEPSARRVEAVIIPQGRRTTLCVSSQVGCSLACSFCHTGTQVMRGNVGASEIVGQVLLARARRPITNVVFMGQGEPLLNWRAVSRAIGVLTEPKGFALPPRRVLLSTAGVAPLIPRVAIDTPGVRLALSLHAPTDELRSKLMGVNLRWPIAEVMAACAEYVRLRIAANEGAEEEEDDEEAEDEGADDLDVLLHALPPRGQRFNGTRRVRVSFEYVLLHGVNDSPRDAATLVSLLSGWHPRSRLHAHVNLIPFNPWTGGSFRAPPREAVTDFAAALREEGFATTVRRARGDDVGGACGQLRTNSELKKKWIS